ncbi:MAG: phosphotransferase family protein [Hydrocarboniphaga sp.]|nr:phosphotransferase family protein [Hydrocarboniphaga sp.]
MEMIISAAAANPSVLNASTLESLIRRVVPDAQGISGLRRLSGGASQETWAFDADLDAGKLALILRRAPGGEYRNEAASGLDIEAAVIAQLERLGVAVPRVRYVLLPDDGLGYGFVTEHVEGETIPRKILRDTAFDAIRPRLAFEFGRVLASIHRAPLEAMPPLRLLPARETLVMLRAIHLKDVTPRPVLELAFRWLADHLPAASVLPQLVHGDFRNGNLIVGADRIRAVLDWELVHLGDPMEDLGWLCLMPWRFGAVDAPVGGLGQREDLFAGYEAGGGAVDAQRVRWWEVLGSLRWAIACADMVSVFRSGADRTVERAMVARRASENEIDLLRLLQLGD